MKNIKEKLVVITGASRGIGAATARVFAQAGANVALFARDTAALEALAAELGTSAVAVGCDVSDAASVEVAVGRAEDRFGPTEVLINNAGVIEPIAHLDKADPADWSRAIDINLKGVYHGMRAVLPGMKSRGSGTILTVSSGAAHNPLEGWGAYCASKAGAAMLTRVCDQEMRGQGIRAIGLSPGTVATDMQVAIRQSGVNAVSRLDPSVHIPADWPARALLWMCGPVADGYLGQEVQLRDEAVRRQIGLIA